MQLSAVEFIPAGLALSLLWEKRTGPFPLQQEEPVHEALPPWAALCGLGDLVLFRFMSQKVFVSSEQSSALALPPQGGGRPWV